MEDFSKQEKTYMQRAIELANPRRRIVSPNPSVGALIVTSQGECFEGVTEPVGGSHAEIVALKKAGNKARGAVLFSTLEPCSHYGHTPPCADVIIDSGIKKVFVGIEDPDKRVQGQGIQKMKKAGLDVSIGLCKEIIEEQLQAYIVHRKTGRPFVILKLAITIDGGIAAPDGTSNWITGPQARQDVHMLRSLSDAILVGAGTIRKDDPQLSVRAVQGIDPLRVVLGKIPPGAKAIPAKEMTGDLEEILQDLGRQGVLQLLVEGGAKVASQFHDRSLVDRYVFYMAPALFGGGNYKKAFEGKGIETISDIWRGEFVSVVKLGQDLRIDLVPKEKAI